MTYNLSASQINARAILDFYRIMDKIGAENHSLLIIKDDKTVFEEYLPPYGKDYPHTLFSITKTAVQLAVGFAIEEKRFDLDTKILPYFQDYPHPESAEWENLTVKRLLMMDSGKCFSFLQDMTDDHARLFMKAKFRKKKGFCYSNNDVHMLSALVQKAVGEPLDEYLMPRLFEPLGIQKPYWEKSPKGVCVGGSGLFLTSRDVGKLSLLFLNGGKYEGKQIVPEKWISESVIDRIKPTKHFYSDGYGYCVWLQDGAYRMDGLFGQFGLALPDRNTVIVLTGAYESETELAELLHTQLVKHLFEESTEEDEQKLFTYLEERKNRLTPICKERNQEKEKLLSQGTFRNKGLIWKIIPKIIGFPNGFLANSLNSSYVQRPKQSFDKFSFRFEEGFCHVEWREEGDTVAFDCGLDGQARISHTQIKGCPYTVWSYGYFEKGKLHIVTRPINTLAEKEFIFSPKKKKCLLTTKTHPDFGTFVAFNGVASGVIPDIPVLTPVIIALMKTAMSIVKIPVSLKLRS